MPSSLVHLVREPRATATPSTPPPTLLLLHGVGSNEHDLFGLAPELDPRFRIVSARAPIELGPGAFGWYEVQFTPNGIVWEPEQAQRSLTRLTEFVEGLAAEHRPAGLRGGPDGRPKLFLLGFSQGAIMTLALALTRPELVAGAVALSGRFLVDELRDPAAPERLRGRPILVQHGLYDEVLPIEHGRATRDALAKLPVDLTYQEYPIGHQVSAESLAAVSRWLDERLG
jgi:phospholipase/carboxylesterase